MIDRKEIELLIKAKLQGKADIATVTKSIVDLEAAIDSQVAAAKKGVGSIDDLKDSYRKLEQVAAQLASAGSLIGSFEKQQKAVAKSETAVKSLGDKYAELKAKLDAAGNVTDAQQERLVKLSARYDRATASLEKQRSVLAELETSLKDAGIASDQLAQASERIRVAAAQTGVALVKNRDAQATFNADLRAANKIIEDKAAAEKAAARDADLFAAAEGRATAASRARAVAEQEAQEILARRRAATAAARTAQASGQGTAAGDAADAARVRELAALRADIEQRSAASARDSGLAQTAADAQKTAASFTTLARASSDLAPKVTSVRDAVNSILNPGAEARSTLAGVEASVGQLATTIAAIKGPVRDYQEQFKELAAASKAIANQGALVDTFRRQVVALRDARTEFTNARAKVNEYAAAVRQGGEAGASFTRALAEAQTRARGAAEALAAQVGATRAARDALRGAGIDSGNLANAETRLSETARQATASTQTLAKAVKQYGEESGKASVKNPFADNGRTTLSLVQRIRGEVLSLAAAYVGLQGGIGLAKSAIDAFNTREGSKNQLALSVGQNKALIDAEYEYVRAQADRIGFEFETAVKGYAKFSASATLAGRAQQETRFIFESVAEVGRVANLTADNLDGVFKALEQIFSKGSIQAEELRGQLGDRLFGAFQVAADSLKDTFPDLNKALKDGLVTSDQLVRIIARYKEIVAGQLPDAQQSLAANQMRLNNAVFDFKTAIADGGFADAYKQALVEVTTFLKSENGKKFAQDLSSLFTTLAQALVFAANNADLLQAALVAFVGVKATTVAAELITNMVLLSTASGTATVALTGVQLAVSRIKLAFAALSAFIVGWEIGTVIYEKFSWVQKVSAYVVGGLHALWLVMAGGAETAFNVIPTLAKNAFAGLINAATFGVRQVLGLFSTFARAVGSTGLADSIDKSVEGLTVGYTKLGNKSDEIRKKLIEDLKTIKQNIDSAGYVAPTGPAAGAKAAAQPTAQPPLPPLKKTGPTEADIAKRKTLIEEIRKALETLDARVERTQTDTLSSQLKAVDIQYQALARKIETLGGPEASKFLEQLFVSKGNLQLQITRKFNEELLKEQEAVQNKLEGIEALGGKKQKNELQQRLDAIATSYADLYRQIAAEREKADRNGLGTATADSQKARLDAGVKRLQNIERIKFASEELKVREEGVNKELDTRAKLIAAVNAQKEVGTITDVQAAAQINQINADAVPKIQEAALAATQWAAANGAIFGTPELQQAFIASMDAIAVRARNVNTEFTNMQKYIGSRGASSISSGLDNVAQNLTDMATRQKSVSQGFKDMAQSAGQALAGFLRDIALAIIKLMIFNQMKQSGNPYVAAIGAAGASSVNVNHAGGLVGRVNSRTRVVSPALFANAPRYHQGGVAGLGPDEYATILQKNEEVLKADSPRNIMNGGGLTAKSDGGGSNRFVLVDDRTKVPEAMASAEGEMVTMVHLRRNIATLKQMLR